MGLGHAHGRTHDLIYIHRTGIRLARLTGEDPDLLDDVRHAVGLLHNQGELSPQCLGGGVPSSLNGNEEMFGQSANPHQRLLQFMNDRCHHLAERSQPIGGYGKNALGRQLALGFLRGHAGRDVRQDVNDCNHLAGIIQDWFGKGTNHRSSWRTTMVSLRRLFATRVKTHPSFGLEVQRITS